jgi:hypothetical protein
MALAQTGKHDKGQIQQLQYHATKQFLPASDQPPDINDLIKS